MLLNELAKNVITEANRPKKEMDAENKAKVQLKELKAWVMMAAVVAGWAKAIGNKVGMLDTSIRENLDPILAKSDRAKVLLDGMIVKLEDSNANFSFPAPAFIDDLKKAFEEEAKKGKKEALDIFNTYHAIHTAAGNKAKDERTAIKRMTIDFDDSDIDRIKKEFKTSGKGFETHLDDLFNQFGLEPVKKTIDIVLQPKDAVKEGIGDSLKQGWKKFKNYLIQISSKMNTKLDKYINTLEKMDSLLDQINAAAAKA